MAYTAKHPKAGTSSYLLRMPCPKCSKTAEHSAARIHKNKNLICPHCSTLFLPSERKN